LGPCNASRNERAQSISAAIEGAIIPRLMLAQGAVSRTPRSAASMPKVIDAAAIAGFGELVLDGAPEAPAAYIEKLLADSFPLERIYLELLAPTARHLGSLWEADTVSFVDVMEGLSKLQGLLRNFGPNSVDLDADGPRYRILLATTPGEQHHFGIVMVDEFFRRAGWGTTCLPASTADELVAAVRREHYSIVGLSISCEGFLENLAHSIHKIRRSSRNRSVRVIVGGNVLIDRPDLVALVGLHYAVQIVRPRFGYGSDIDGRRTPWIVGGIAVLAAGGILAAVATTLMAQWLFAGMALAAVAFALVGLGVGAAGTSLLALLAKRVDPHRRAAAATIVWMMMIAGFALTAATAGADIETIDALKIRLLEDLASPPQGGAEADYVAWAKEHSASISRVWVYEQEPYLGQITVRFALVVPDGGDSTDVIPSGGDATSLQTYLRTKAPAHVADYVYAAAPTPRAIDIDVTLTPDTSDIRDAIEDYVDDLFATLDIAPGGTLYQDDIRDAIRRAIKSVDPDGQFELNTIEGAAPADIDLADGVLPVIGVLTEDGGAW
jgi:methanogenic corrinoid protein MtbC1